MASESLRFVYLSVTIKTESEKTRDVISDHFSQDVADLRQEISHIKYTIAKVASKVGVEV